MISFLSKLIIKDIDNTADERVRQAYGMLCGGVGIGLNVLLFLGKALAGYFSGSIAITADAFNNLSDAGSSVITLVGFKMAGQKADSRHPFGHGRIEYISGFLVSVIILIMAFELFQASLQKILHPAAIESGPAVIGVLCASVLVKLYMFLYNRSIGKKIESAAMEATAKDSLSDTLITMTVLATALLSRYTGLILDGYCGVVVAAIVFLAGLGAARETIGPLLGQPPEPAFVEKVEDIIMEYREQGVIGMHDLVVHNYGPGRIMLSVHVEVPSDGEIMTLHELIDLIEHRLRRELNCSAVIHMDPVCLNDGLTNEWKGKVADIISGMEGKVSFHDFRIVRGAMHTNLIFDVVVPFDYPMSDSEVAAYIQNQVFLLDQNFFVLIDVDKASG